MCFCVFFMPWVTVNNWPFKGLIKFSGPGILTAATKMEFFFWLRCKICLKFVQNSFCYRKSLIYNDTFFPSGYHKAFPLHNNSVVFVLLGLKCDHSLLVKDNFGFWWKSCSFYTEVFVADEGISSFCIAQSNFPII